jgi:plastocyanin
MAAGCSAKGTVPPMDDQGRYVIRMTDALRFEPAEARVPSGATVVWVNAGQEAHDVAAYVGDPPSEDYPRFFSPKLHEPQYSVDAGMSYNATLNEDGAWTIWCHRHHESDMRGVVHVG